MKSEHCFLNFENCG